MIVVIMRGVPGSGKSTTAQGIMRHCVDKGQTCRMASNDNYPGYYDNPEKKYDWTPQKAKEAKKYCQKEFLDALTSRAYVIIVDNCHLTHRSYRFYELEAEKAGYDVSFNVKEPQPTCEYITTCANRNKHGVTADHICKMIKSWES